MLKVANRFLFRRVLGGRQDLEKRVTDNLVLLGETLEFASDRLEVVSTDVLPASELEVR